MISITSTGGVSRWGAWQLPRHAVVYLHASAMAFAPNLMGLSYVSRISSGRHPRHAAHRSAP
jgi:hypothetical protein